MPRWEVSPKDTFRNLTKDFVAAWNGIAGREDGEVGRGNFLFGLLATVLLEWACRLCKGDSEGKALRALARSLYEVERRYFTSLPTAVPVGVRRKGFDLPESPCGSGGPPLLWALFDLIRNGQAHQYQQIPARLQDDCYLWISIRGAESGRTFADGRPRRASDHLAFCEYQDGNLGIRVRADVFFADIRSAIENSGILCDDLPFRYLERSWNVSRCDLIKCLDRGGHGRFSE